MTKSSLNLRDTVLAGRTLTGMFSLTAAILITHSTVLAQGTKTVITPINPVSADKSSPTDENQAPSPLAEEMRIKRAIKYAEKEHKESLGRAREMSDLGHELATAFKRKQSLDREDMKKLDRLEKLAKRIRSDAGGSDDEVSLDKRPQDLADALDRIAEVSASLNDKVQETPRQVISATIIDKANVLLELINAVRNFSAKAST